MRMVTLTTDFGTKDWFVATMRGVILSREPRARIIDITHSIPPGDIRAGAFALRAAAPYFPKGTVHLAVVDPGVGGPRRAIAIRTRAAWFLGPDNGVLSWAVASNDIQSIRSLENERLFLPEVSCTFHGRDVFAPVAAYLTGNRAESKLGSRLDRFRRLSWPEPRREGRIVQGEVLYVDRFGNGITNLAHAEVGMGPGWLTGGGRRKWRCPLSTHYAAVAVGQPVAVRGSTGFLEIAVHGGSAAATLQLAIGDAVRWVADSPDS